MSEKPVDVLAIGNAIVDVIADADDSFLDRHGMTKGSMRLIDAAEAERLYSDMGPGRELSGGSAANAVAGLAALGLRTGFIGQLGDDELGKIFAHDIQSLGVEFDTPPSAIAGSTGRCLILVTGDAQRTMCTFLGAAQRLDRRSIGADRIARAGILYVEGYLWDPPEPRAAIEAAIEMARSAATKVAFTLSDSFVVERHRDDFLRLIETGKIDILFANEVEFLHLAHETDLEPAIAKIAADGPDPGGHAQREGRDRLGRWKACQGCGRAHREAGRYDRRRRPVRRRLPCRTGPRQVARAVLRLGAIAASEVIQHYGARPELDLAALAGPLLQ
jgi:sugar/nucleoside kinase (ribokinase family)